VSSPLSSFALTKKTASSKPLLIASIKSLLEVLKQKQVEASSSVSSVSVES
jgi:hypothetical protein